MKAIILEIRDGWAAALREDGVVVKTRQLGEVGATIELSEKTVSFPVLRSRVVRSAVAAVLALAITGGTYTYTNVAAASYVTLDTEETSVELSINRMGRVVGVRALSGTSAELARELLPDVRRKSVEDAMDIAMAHMGGAPTVVAGITGENERRGAELHEAVERGMGRREHDGVEFFAFDVSRDERREAGERDMSGGRWAFEHHGGMWHGDDGRPVPPPDWQMAPPPPPEGQQPPPPPPEMHDDDDDWDDDDDDDRENEQDDEETEVDE